MKKTIKILTTAILAVGFGSLVHAQSATISANASVISQLTVANDDNLNFGTIIIGQIKTIDASDNVSVSTGTAIGSANRGRFTVTAQYGSNVELRFTLPSNLSKADGGLLPISFPHQDIYFAELMDEGASAIPFDPRSAYTINGFNSNTGMDNYTMNRVYIGGRVDATGATAGTYAGNITLSATYN